MITMNKTVNIPKLLWKLHGKNAFIIDLILTYSLGIILLIFNILNTQKLEFWEAIIIGFLSIDIGGGVISNFTRGTIKYYKESNISPHFFIWFHTLQTVGLIIIYNELFISVALLMGVAMVGSSITIASGNTNFQKQTSVFFFALVIILMSSYSELPIPLKTLTVLMSFKIIVGFAAHYRKIFN